MPSSDLSLQAVKQLGSELLSSKSHINNAPLLLSILSKHHGTSECLLEALRSLHAFFEALIRNGELSTSSSRQAAEVLQQRQKSHGGDDVGETAEAIYKSWLWDKYNEFVNALLLIVGEANVKPSLQIAGLDILMDFTRQEKKGEFSNRIFSKVCDVLVLQDVDSQIVKHLVANYLKYFDVCCHTCATLQKIALKGYETKVKGANSSIDATSKTSFESLMCHIFDVLACMRAPKMATKDAHFNFESWSMGSNLSEKKSLKKLKSSITKAWLTFLQLPLSPMLYEKALGNMHDKIIPNLSNPILLSDFLTTSYNKGGVISVMALSGLFSLIMDYGLEYPDFYSKLYALLEPSIFLAKYKARFFELLDQCLKSPLLPSYLAAAFAKKLGRLALTSPPSGALIIIAIVHNLLRRHPSVNVLVHQDFIDPEMDSTGAIIAEEMGEELKSPTAERREETRPGMDPYDLLELDPAKCNALKSSLWELDALRHHYCPAVSRFVSSLETDLTVRAKTTELSIKDFSSGSYSTIFTTEVGRRMKQVPLAFYKSIPTTLFPRVSASESSGIMDFPGWSFGGGENNHNVDDLPVSQGPENKALVIESSDYASDHQTAKHTISPKKRKKNR